MRRRDVLAGLGAAGLASCASAPVAPPPRLINGRNYAPLDCSMDRVTKTVVGLRPYRPAGYRLETEEIGDQTIIHNYGHGGCGVTLSWGCAAAAADMAEQTGQRRAAVLGAGVMGLTAALILARRGLDVTVYAEALPPHTTSNIAGVLWMPTGYYSSSVATADFHRRDWQLIRRAHRGILPYVNRPGYGVYWSDYHYLSASPRNDGEWPGGNDLYPEISVSTENTLFGFPRQERLKAVIIDPDYYLDQILQDAQTAGARFVRARFETLEDVRALDETLVVNCTGLGAGALFGDETMTPVQGQLSHLLPQPEIDYAYVANTAEGTLYMFPRRTGIVLGGTSKRGQWSLEPDPAEIRRMVEGHAGLAARLQV